MGDVEDEIFVTTLRDPNAWMQKANGLLAVVAAFDHKIDDAWRDAFVSEIARAIVHHTLPVYLMLNAFALENILKAFIVRMQRAQWTAIKQIPKELRTHDLFILSKTAKTQATAPAYREELLRRLSRSSTWYGRYPIPVDSLHLAPTTLSNQEKRDLSYTTGADVDEIRCLVRDLKAEYLDI